MFLHDWADSGIDGMMHDFEIEDSDLKGVEILLASYAYANYSGDAFVLFSRDGKLFEVDGSHCSCYGLEGQWKPEETTVAALRHRMEKGNLGDSYSENLFATELKSVLDGINEVTQ